MKDVLAALLTPERSSEIWNGAAVEEIEQDRATRLLRRALKALGHSAIKELRGRERYLVARLLRRRTKVSSGWLAGRFGLQTASGMRNGLYLINNQLMTDGKLRRTWRTLEALS